VSRGSLTTTSYAILGLLSVKSWSTYELTQQMDRSLGRMWPRAQSKLYEEPKKLVAHRLATASEEAVGNRARTVYSITEKGHTALAEWLQRPAAGPALESESLLKVFFADGGTTDDLRATLGSAHQWAVDRSAESVAVGEQYRRGDGPFPERMAVQQLTVRFLHDFYALVASWALWAEQVIENWPERPADARPDPAEFDDSMRRARAVADQARQ
jgi:DNA-binding PadR family transcriptional regulator